jgi:hypothetical protein
MKIIKVCHILNGIMEPFKMKCLGVIPTTHKYKHTFKNMKCAKCVFKKHLLITLNHINYNDGHEKKVRS